MWLGISLLKYAVGPLLLVEPACASSKLIKKTFERLQTNIKKEI